MRVVRAKAMEMELAKVSESASVSVPLMESTTFE
jgi:hypothetical protein